MSQTATKQKNQGHCPRPYERQRLRGRGKESLFKALLISEHPKRSDPTTPLSTRSVSGCVLSLFCNPTLGRAQAARTPWFSQRIPLPLGPRHQEPHHWALAVPRDPTEPANPCPRLADRCPSLPPTPREGGAFPSSIAFAQGSTWHLVLQPGMLPWGRRGTGPLPCLLPGNFLSAPPFMPVTKLL